MNLMRLDDLLYSQGFGTRRVCAGLVQQGHVRVAGQVVDDPAAEFDVSPRTHAHAAAAPGVPAAAPAPQEGDHSAATPFAFDVQGQRWTYHARAYLMLHKPAGTECSQKPSAWPSIYTLLPAPLRQRPGKHAVPGVQAAGRLDQDTTGLLLLTDDGAWLHRLSSPKHHVPKVYQATVKHPLDERQLQRLLQGVVLDDDPRPVRAAACQALAPQRLQLTLTEGKYHQVKRMVAAVGNRVETLHRSQIGALTLPADLPPGAWRWLSETDLQAVSRAAA